MFEFLRRKQAAAPRPLLQAAAEPPGPAPSPALSGGDLHIPRARLSQKNLHIHYAINAIREELEAVDWYRQRADDTDDPELKSILLHNANEEVEHAAMVLEWIRRREPRFDKELKEYLFSTAPITQIEKEEEKKDAGK